MSIKMAISKNIDRDTAMAEARLKLGNVNACIGAAERHGMMGDYGHGLRCLKQRLEALIESLEHGADAAGSIEDCAIRTSCEVSHAAG